MSTLSRAQIENALSHLGRLALQEQTTIELLVMGGAAMVLGYQARESTHDIDALIPYLVPGSELKAKYAFADLWEKLYDTAE